MAFVHVSHHENDVLQEPRHQEAAKAPEEKGETPLWFLSCIVDILCKRHENWESVFYVPLILISTSRDSQETFKLLEHECVRVCL